MKKLAILSLLTGALFLAAAVAVNAAELAPVDFHAKILNVDGTEVQVSAVDKSPLTLGKMSEDALIANNLPGDNPALTEKGDRFRLALKIHAGKEQMTADEVVLLKKVIGLAYGPLPVGRALELLPK